MLVVAATWISPVADPWYVTELEVVEIDETSMKQHTDEVSQIPYAMKNDVSHLENVMIDEQICDAQSEVDAYEDAEADGTATPADSLDKKRKEKYVERRKGKIINDGHDTHGDCE